MEKILKEVAIPLKTKKEWIKKWYELIFPQKCRLFIILIISFTVTSFFYFLDLTITSIYLITSNLLEINLNIFLVLLSLLVTAYALFQAGLSKTNLRILSKKRKDKINSAFSDLNIHFFLLGLSYLIFIMIIFLISLILKDDIIGKMILGNFKFFLLKWFDKVILKKIIIFLWGLFNFISIFLIFDMKSLLKHLFIIFKLTAVNILAEDGEKEATEIKL